ncbi:hypothetical protein M5K25_000131 [Dendrobium thyrsiflorum]|uniref:USP domain-containing protein n=1 Tax=Dendrobium thyrsiflorum TaxID=117978 RepID=A0ABD0W919_DENTH
MWKNICKTTIKAKNNFVFKVSVNSPISLRWDYVCNGLYLYEVQHHHSLLYSFHENAPLSELYDPTGWIFPTCYHADVQNAIRPIPIIRDGSANCLNWAKGNVTKFGHFMKDYYRNDNEINSSKKKTGAIAPKRFVQRVKKRNEELFRSYMHQDAHEFLIFLLNELVDILEKEANAKDSLGTSSQSEKIANGSEKIYLHGNDVQTSVQQRL